MLLITPEQRALLVRNGEDPEFETLMEKPPLLKLFTPDAGGTWLISAIDPNDPDRAWGLCDPGLGSPELGWISLSELAAVMGPLGLAVCRDEAFRPNASLRAYAAKAGCMGIIIT